MKADKLIIGNIITMDNAGLRAEAMAVKDGKILYVGSKQAAREFCDEKTEVTDYGTNYIYPGFMDAHCHGVLTGWRRLDIEDISKGKSYKEYIDLMKEYIDSNPGRDYYMGSGWIERADRAFTREDLDAVSPGVFAAMHSDDGHSMLVNTMVLEYLGINAESAKQYKTGEVELDASGNPNGMIHETPVDYVIKNIPMGIEQIKKYILKWQDIAISKGFTAVAEAGSAIISPCQNDAYIALANEGRLKLRTYTYNSTKNNTDTPEKDVEEVAELARKINSEYHKIIGLKVFLDGIVEARTAWMQNEYLDEPGYYGVKTFGDHDKMVRLIKAASKHKLEVHCHCMGDGAAKFILDCIEEAQAEIGNNDQRNCLAHLEFVTPEDIKRCAKTGTVAVTPPTWAYAFGTPYENAVKCVGKEAMEKQYPIKSFIDAGALTVAHSDYPTGPYLDIPMTILMACYRYNPLHGKETVNNIPECVTRKEAIEMMTRNVAIQFREEDRLGTLEAGKIANATVFDKDFLTCSEDEIIQAQVIATIIDGYEV